LWQVRLDLSALDEFLQARLDGGLGEEFAEEINLTAKVVVGNRFGEFLRCDGGALVEFFDLRGGGAGEAQRFPLSGQLAYQSYGSGFLSIDGAARQQQIANHRIPQIALQARDSAKSRHQAEAQLGKAEARHLVGDDEVAGQRQLEPAAESDAVDSGDGDQRGGVHRV